MTAHTRQRKRCKRATRGFTLLEVLIVVVVVAVLAISAILWHQRSVFEAKLVLQRQHLAQIVDHLEMYQAENGAYPPNLRALVRGADRPRPDDGGLAPFGRLPANPLGVWGYRESDGRIWPIDYDPRSPNYLPPQHVGPGNGNPPPRGFPWAGLFQAVSAVALTVRLAPWVAKRLSLRRITKQALRLATAGNLQSLAGLEVFVHLHRSEPCLKPLKKPDRVSLVLGQMMATAPTCPVVIRIYHEWAESLDSRS